MDQTVNLTSPTLVVRIYLFPPPKSDTFSGVACWLREEVIAEIPFPGSDAIAPRRTIAVPSLRSLRASIAALFVRAALFTPPAMRRFAERVFKPRPRIQTKTAKTLRKIKKFPTEFLRKLLKRFFSERKFAAIADSGIKPKSFIISLF